MAGASSLVSGNEARRVVNAARDLVLVTPAGGMKLADTQEPELEWLRLSKGKTGNLNTGRKVLKLMSAIKELGDELTRTGQGSATNVQERVTTDLVLPTTRDLALVPYTPRRVLRPQSADTDVAFSCPRPSVPVQETSGGDWYWQYSKAVGTTLFELWAPWVAVALWVMRRLPGCIFVVTSLYVAFMVGYLVAHPELVVKGLFGLLDLVPQYASYATNQIANQFQIELAARLR